MPFEKGKSGNPGGRPKIVGEVRELAQKHSKKAIETLVSIMKDKKAHPKTRLAACNAILDRAIGKPTQSHELSGPEGAPIPFVDRPPTETREEWEKRIAARQLKKD